MACLNSYDLVAYPGSRYFEVFTVTTQQALADKLRECLVKSLWTVEVISNGYKATSSRVPYCGGDIAPDEFIGKCKVQFIKNPDSGFFGTLTKFQLMSVDETLIQNVGTEVLLVPSAEYQYAFIGNPYQFTLVMLGVNKRNDNSISNQFTALMCGVPQIPSFLAGRSGWCQYGLNELSFLWQIDNCRLGPLYGGDYAGIVSSQYGQFLSNNFGRIMLNGDVEGGSIFDTQTNNKQGMWLLNDNPLTNSNPINWWGMFCPPIISWYTSSASPKALMKGFLWDCVLINKKYSPDDKLTFDNHTFLVLNGFDGYQGHPPSSLCLAIDGNV